MALSGFGTGCINFYGITEIPPDEADFDRPVFGATDKDKVICLVFERASGGPVLNYLDRQFACPVDNVTRWKLLILVFEMVANGLITLHDRNIMHRDLHFGNVLARTTVYESEVPGKQKLENCVLSDLGEGKVLDDGRKIAAVGVMSYGAGEFKPPEVRGRQGWTTKGDVYSMGVMMKKTEENERNRRWDQERQEGSDGGEMIVDRFKVPTAFREIRRRCVKQDPEARPSARRVALDMEKLYADVERGRGEWEDADDSEDEFLY